MVTLKTDMKIAMLYASWERFGETWSTSMSIKTELISRGYEVISYNLYHNDGELLRDKNIRTYSAQGINILHEHCRVGYKPDIVFCLDYGQWDCVQFDKKYFPGSIVISESGDDPQAFRSNSSKAFKSHAMLSPDWRCVQAYRAHNVNAHWWTHFADERLFYPRDIAQEFGCVTTCGPRGNGLTEKVKEALNDLFNNERYFYGKDYAERLAKGKIVFQCSQYKEITRRIFEGMACRKLVITDRLPEETNINQLFAENEDIVYYDSADEAIDKIKYYLENESEREKIANSGYAKVMKDHTAKARVDALLKVYEELS